MGDLEIAVGGDDARDMDALPDGWISTSSPGLTLPLATVPA